MPFLKRRSCLIFIHLGFLMALFVVIFFLALMSLASFVMDLAFIAFIAFMAFFCFSCFSGFLTIVWITKQVKHPLENQRHTRLDPAHIYKIERFNLSCKTDLCKILSVCREIGYWSSRHPDPRCLRSHGASHKMMVHTTPTLTLDAWMGEVEVGAPASHRGHACVWKDMGTDYFSRLFFVAWTHCGLEAAMLPMTELCLKSARISLLHAPKDVEPCSGPCSGALLRITWFPGPHSYAEYFPHALCRLPTDKLYATC